MSTFNRKISEKEHVLAHVKPSIQMYECGEPGDVRELITNTEDNHTHVSTSSRNGSMALMRAAARFSGVRRSLSSMWTK